MHVLVTADTVGGVWTYTRELVTGLSQRGHHVTLVSFGEIPTHSQREWLDGLRNVDYRATAFKLEWMQDSHDDLKQSREFLEDVISDTHPDLLHFSQYCYGTLKTSIPKVVVAHSDVVSWWVAVHGEEPQPNEWIGPYREIVRNGLADADVIVAPTRWMLQAASTYYGGHRNGIVIYNGRNPGLFNPHTTKEDLAVTVGRVWDKAKQVSLLTQGEHHVPVWIAGEEQHPDPAFQGNDRFRARGVRLCGKQSEAQLRQLFSRASMYIATSQYEPFGLAPVEAAFSRCAIVSNDIPTFRELWGETACYFERNNPEDLARKIDQLQNDKTLRLTYANLAYRRARQRYTAERMVSDYLNLYQSLVPAGAVAA
jgi:glycosyltransferase involved in cell wall biosynthesis